MKTIGAAIARSLIWLQKEQMRSCAGSVMKCWLWFASQNEGIRQPMYG